MCQGNLLALLYFGRKQGEKEKERERADSKDGGAEKVQRMRRGEHKRLKNRTAIPQDSREPLLNS